MKFKIKNKIQRFLTDRILVYEENDLFKEYSVILILFVLTIFGLIGIIPSVISGIQEGKFILLSFMLLAYSTIPFLLLKRKIPYEIRSGLLCAAMFLCGFVVMTNAPLVSSARLWFLTTTVTACFLINLKMSLVYFFLSMTTLIFQSHLISYSLSDPDEPGVVLWIITLSSYVVINAIVVGVAYLMSLGKEKAEEDLDRSSHLKYNQNLIQKIEEYIVILRDIEEQLDTCFETVENKEAHEQLNNMRDVLKVAEDYSKEIIEKLPERNLY